MTGLIDILARIATIQRLIISPETTRPLKAYDFIPQTMAVAQMPCFVNFPGSLRSNVLIGSDERAREFREVRDIRMVLYHSSIGAGVNEEKSGLLVPYFELVYEQFGLWPRLQMLAGIVDALIISDTGVGTSTYVGNTYYAISFTLQITRIARRVLEDTD